MNIEEHSEVIEPPIRLLFRLCIDWPIKEQARLTNQVMLRLLFEKHGLLKVLEKLKQVFFHKRGDLADMYVRQLYNG
jgi:hypothetical protein